MRPARIAFIGQRGVPATFGGIEHHVEEVGSRLAARGHEVTVYTRANYTSEHVREHRGMRVRYLPTLRTKRLEALVHSGLSTGAAMLPGAGAPDILHYHAIGPSIFTPIPRFLSRRGVVLTIHGLDYQRDKWGVGDQAALRVAGWVSAHVPHATITVARYLADHYREQYNREAHYIPNGVVAAHPRSAERITARWGLHGGDYLLFLGRLVPEKAPDVLLRAFRRVDTTARLVIAGGSSFTDSYVTELEARAAQDPRVVMAGPVYGAERDELYSNAAAFVLPSNLEGLPLTLLEALSFGLPVVASDIPAHLEVLGAGGPGGRLFPRRDEAALCGTLEAMLADPARERSGAADLAARVLPEYDWDKATDATEEVYETVLRARPARSRRGAAPR